MNVKRKFMISCVLILMIITLGGVGAYTWYNSNYYVTTEDARLAADFVKVIPLASGKLLNFNVKVGDYVVKDQLLGHIEADAAAGAAANIRAPISGRVVEKSANIGELELSAQAPTLALIVDPNQIYINANIEETKLGKIKLGQQVDITIDQFKNKTIHGKIESIGEATNSEFSLLPTSSGEFTKVVQKMPIKITIGRTDMHLILGASAVIKIHVK